jgi:hypothetical protein
MASTPIFRHLQEFVAVIHARWVIYRKLYLTNQERVRLLNTIAGGFFYDIQNVLFSYVVLGICKLTDKPEMRGKKNLVLKRLCNELKSENEIALAESLEKRLEIIEQKCGPFRDYRNQWISHHDLKTAIQEEQHPILNQVMVEDVLELIHGFMNEVEGDCGFDNIVVPGDADALLTALIQAHEYNKLTMNGTISPDSIRKSEYWDDALR